MQCTLLVSEAFELYRVEYIVYRNQSLKTEEMNRLAMKALISHIGDIPVSELTFDRIRKWKDDLSKSRSQNTVRGYIVKLRVVLSYLRMKGYINVLNPEVVGVPKRKTTVVEFITPEEVVDLIDKVFTAQSGYSTLNRYRNRALISLLYASGVRVSELCSMNRLSIREDNTFTIIGKGDVARLCFIDSRTKIYVDEYLALRKDKQPALFISELTGKRVTSGTVQEIFRIASEKCGFSKCITPHTLRHSFATNLLRNKTNIVYVRDFLGHKSVQTTEMYTHVVNEDLKEIYQTNHSY